MPLPYRSLALVCALAHAATASAQLDDFADLEATTGQGFFRDYVTDLWHGFRDFGDPCTVTGGIGLDLRSYVANGGEPRQDPFFYSLNANVNTRLYKLDLPLSVVVTARNTESSLPNFKELAQSLNPEDKLRAQRDRFIRFGVSPHYKWVRGHFGHRSMTFSQFTLSNLNFLGAGLELTPEGWVAAGMYGRLQKAEPIDLSLATPNLPVYERTGWGARLGRQTEDARLELVLFGASDDPSSVAFASDALASVAPEQNLVIGINAEQLFFERFRLRAEIAQSSLTPDRSHPAVTQSRYPGFLFRERETSTVDYALDFGVDYEGEAFTTGVQLLRVDPGYRSFGAYFFNNDVFDLLGNVGFDLFGQTTSFALSAGVESNNLDLSRESTTKRFVYNGDVAYSGAKGFTAAVNYSNNTSEVGYVLNEALDSLNAVIVAENAGLQLGFNRPDGMGNQHGVTFSANAQQVRDDVADAQGDADTRVTTSVLSYSYALSDAGWRFTARTSYNTNELQAVDTRRVGFGGAVDKAFLDGKLTTGLSADHFANTSSRADASSTLQLGLRAGYQLTDALSLDLNTRLQRTTAAAKPAFAETITTLGLRQALNWQWKKGQAKVRKASAKTDETPPSN